MILACVLASAVAAAPTVAMFRLSTEQGANESLSKLVAERVGFHLRESGAFERVLSSLDIESVITLEQQRQAMDCTASSCMAEVAAGLNVDYVVAGSLGRLGESFLLSLRLVDARTGLSRSAVSERLRGASEEVLIEGSETAVMGLLNRAGLPHKLVAAGPSLPRETRTQPPEQEPATSGNNKAWWGVAAAGALVAVAAVPAVMLAGLAAYGVVGAVVFAGTQASTTAGAQGWMADGAGAAAGLGAAVFLLVPAWLVGGGMLALGVLKAVM